MPLVDFDSLIEIRSANRTKYDELFLVFFASAIDEVLIAPGGLCIPAARTRLLPQLAAPIVWCVGRFVAVEWGEGAVALDRPPPRNGRFANLLHACTRLLSNLHDLQAMGTEYSCRHREVTCQSYSLVCT